jgi:hypothetical protein
MIETDFERFVEEASGRFYGKYGGVVTANDGSSGGLKPGSIEVKVPAVLGDTPMWALPCVPYAGSKVGFFAMPPVGASVWVEFEGGRRDHPIWTGCFWQDDDLDSSDAKPDTILLKTQGATIRIEDSGTVEIETTGGAKLTMTGTEITLEAPSIKNSANGGATSLSASGFDAMNGALTVM